MNGGLARQIFSNTEVLDQIKDFYHGVATPLVRVVKLREIQKIEKMEISCKSQNCKQKWKFLENFKIKKMEI